MSDTAISTFLLSDILFSDFLQICIIFFDFLMMFVDVFFYRTGIDIRLKGQRYQHVLAAICAIVHKGNTGNTLLFKCVLCFLFCALVFTYLYLFFYLCKVSTSENP